LTPGTVAAGNGPQSVAVAPSGQFAYVANLLSGDVSQYSIGADGSLSPLAPATVDSGSDPFSDPFSITVEPSGKFVYVANWGTHDVSQYSIGGDGGLSPLTPATVAAGDAPVALTVEPSGQFAYVASENDNKVSQYRIEADGTLTPLDPDAVNAGRNPTAITTVGASR